MAEIRLHKHEADGGLPDICMSCGGEATTTVGRDMSWYPPWVNLLILIALPLAMVVAMIMTKRARLEAPFCKAHKGHWFKRNLINVGMFFLFGIIGIIGFALGMTFLPQNGPNGDLGFLACFFPVAMFLAWLVVLVIVQNSGIRPVEITDNELVLKGVAPEFVDALEAMERKRRRKNRWRDDEDYDDDEPLPRKKAVESDAIEEERPRKKKPRADANDD
jgi:hypothetical protein